MANSAVVILLILVFVGGGAGLYWFLSDQGFVDRWDGWDRLVERAQGAEERADEAEARAETAEEELARLKAAQEDENLAILWVLSVAGLVCFLLVVAGSSYVSGREIKLKEAIEEAKFLAKQYQRYEHIDDIEDDREEYVYRGILHRTGQVVEGDPNSYWFVITFAIDWPEGQQFNPPHSRCFSYVISSNNPDARSDVYAGNGTRVYDELRMRLQRDIKANEIEQVLSQATSKLALNRIFEQTGVI